MAEADKASGLGVKEGVLVHRFEFQDHGLRDMSPWRDLVDFMEERGFVLAKLKTCGRRHGCNEYVFERDVGER